MTYLMYLPYLVAYWSWKEPDLSASCSHIQRNNFGDITVTIFDTRSSHVFEGTGSISNFPYKQHLCKRSMFVLFSFSKQIQATSIYASMSTPHSTLKLLYVTPEKVVKRYNNFFFSFNLVVNVF